jgi:hypothetical protein
MPQDRASGAAANTWGREVARKIAQKIGAVMKGRSSNEASWNGKRIVIKCAATKTDKVGVTYKMLENLDSVMGAFQLDDRSFELWILTPGRFRRGMSPTRSQGPSAGKVGVAKCDMFKKHGSLVGKVRISPSPYRA